MAWRTRIATAFVCLTWAHAAAPVAADPSGGVVEGHVRYTGKRPSKAPVAVPKSFQSICGSTKTMPDLLAAADKGLANVVVSIAGVPGAKAAAPKDVTINQKSCEYLPHLQAVPVGSKLTVVNSDPVLHNVHATNGSRTLCNMAMPIEGQRSSAPPQVLAKTGRVEFKCDAGHTWMSAYVFVFDHPFYAVSDASGAFRISGLPPGTYDVQIEHELLGTKMRKVTVPATGAAKLEITLE
jgi:plastocyanin